MSLCSAAYGANDSTGTANFAHLKLQRSVRAAAMGSTFVAVADDSSATLLNPAGLTQLTKSEIQFTHNAWLAGTAFSNIVYARPWGRLGVFGGSLTYLSYGEIAETTRSQPGGTSRMFSSSATEYLLSFAHSPVPAVSFGINLKNMQQNIDQSRDSGLGCDVGVLWNPPTGVKYGAVMQNIGIGKTLPSKIKLGVSSRLLERKLLLAGEMSIPSDNNITYHLGAEYALVPFLSLRGGFNTRSEDGAGGNWSLGLGFEWNDFKLDYAYVPYEELGATHRVGLRFGLL
ncbi:MAG: PorV/PorQ family protein [bacterium]